jgi:hypothetical protein
MTAYRRFAQKRSWFACLLVVALLITQAAGLSHMIRHGTPAASTMDAAQPSWSSWTAVSDHSCVLFDAASLGAGLPTAMPGPACDDVARHALASAVIGDEPDLAAVLHFLSRAPPSMEIAV